MANRLRPWLALLISALVHLAVALVLLGQSSRAAGPSGVVSQPGRVLTVSLVVPGRPAPKPAVPAPLVAAHSPPASGGTDHATPAEPRYFDAGVVTEQAVPVEGLVGDNLLIVPGLTSQAVDLQVWISDDGSIDRVELESELSEEQQKLLLAEFAKVRFLPGRIGRVAVHSRMQMRILVDNAIRV